MKNMMIVAVVFERISLPHNSQSQLWELAKPWVTIDAQLVFVGDVFDIIWILVVVIMLWIAAIITVVRAIRIRSSVNLKLQKENLLYLL